MKQTQTQADAAPAIGQHTPGPWEVNHVLTESGRDAIQICTRAKGITRWHIATVMRQGADTEGNARLIASAPDLLRERDQLREALRAIVTTFDQDGWTAPAFMQVQRSVAINEARAALARAERGQG